LLALVVEFGEPVADAGAHGGGCGTVRVGGDGFQCFDLGVLGGVELLDAGGERGCVGVAARLGVGVGGGELGGEVGGALGSEDVIGEEPADDGV